MKPLEHNGVQYSNADAWRTAKATQSPKEQPQEQPEGESPEQVVEAHGPAQEIHITHEHEMGAHHVHSVHGDGHEHHSDHGSAEEAHEHAKKLASGEPQEPDGDEYEPEE